MIDLMLLVFSPALRGRKACASVLRMTGQRGIYVMVAVIAKNRNRRSARIDENGRFPVR